MKFRLLVIILFFTIYLIKNANSVGDGGKESKLYKSFDEIFGKGWDDESNDSKGLNCRHVKEEVQDGQAPNTYDQKNIDEILKQKFDEIYDENWSEDDNEFIEQDEADSTDQNDCIDKKKCQKIQEDGDSGTKLIKRRKNDYSDQKKCEIVEEFISLTEKYKQKRKHSRIEWHKIYAKISKSIGVSLRTIKKWKKEFGLTHKLQSEKERVVKLKQYCEIKKGNPKISDFEIAERLNIGRRTLSQWKREIKSTVKDENYSLLKELDQITQLNVYSDQQKRQILKQFDEIKSKCKKAKLKNISMRELNKKIAKKLGVCVRTIIRWKREFGLSVSNKISDTTKIGILKKFAKIKGKNSKMTNAVIADMLNISSRSLCKWKQQFKDEIKNL